MKFPEKVKIGPRTYTVEFVEDLKTDEGQDLFGEICRLERTIKMNASAGEEWWLDTLLHEIVHAILMDAGHCTETSHEPLVEALGTGLAALFLENPDLLTILSAETKVG